LVRNPDRSVSGELGSEYILVRKAGGVWSELNWLRIGIGGGDERSGSGTTDFVS
jgi:hypothetical protein